jgi:hypothetical protein
MYFLYIRMQLCMIYIQIPRFAELKPKISDRSLNNENFISFTALTVR